MSSVFSLQSSEGLRFMACGLTLGTQGGWGRWVSRWVAEWHRARCAQFLNSQKYDFLYSFGYYSTFSLKRILAERLVYSQNWQICAENFIAISIVISEFICNFVFNIKESQQVRIVMDKKEIFNRIEYVVACVGAPNRMPCSRTRWNAYGRIRMGYTPFPWWALFIDYLR